MGNLSSLASGSGHHAAWIWRNGELMPWESAQAT